MPCLMLDGGSPVVHSLAPGPIPVTVPIEAQYPLWRPLGDHWGADDHL